MRRNPEIEAGLQELFEDFEHGDMCAFLARGWEKRALAKRHDAGEVVKPLRGIYARKDYWEQLSYSEKMLCAIKSVGVAHRSWTFSHATAAAVYGLAVSYKYLWPVHYTTSRAGGGRSPQFFTHHRHALSDGNKMRISDIRVTSPARTIIDCARTMPLPDALAIADSALHSGLTDRADLERELAKFKGTRGVRNAREVIALADPRPESGGESVLRGILYELGIPMPELQVEIPDPEHPGRVYRVDYLFTIEGEQPVALELDGFQKYEDLELTGGKSMAQVMAEERQREAAITSYGIRVARINYKQALDRDFLLRRLKIYGIEPIR